jgi:hypothetical protein
MRDTSIETNTTIWIDLLCFSSAAKVIGLSRQKTVGQIYYINIHKHFRPFLGLMKRFVGKPIVQVLDVVEAELRIADKSLYEIIQNRLTKILTNWAKEKEISRKISAFCANKGFDLSKYKEHLKEAAYYHVFRPVEMQVLAEKISGQGRAIFVLKTSPLKNILRNALGAQRVIFYSPLIVSTILVENRPDYFYDKYISDKYYRSSFQPFLRQWITWLASCVNGLIFGKCRRAIAGQGAKIGVELIQARVRLDDITDLYWFKDSGIDPAKVCGLVFANYDHSSLRELASTGIGLFRPASKLVKNPFSLLKQSSIVLPEKGYFSRTAKYGLKLLLIPFLPPAASWLLFQETRFFLRVKYWESIYSQLGINMLWTMYDAHEEKLIRSQAMTLVGGIYLGSHWSNFPMARIDNQKLYDILFAWNPDIYEDKYPVDRFYSPGYPSDHYFQIRAHKAKILRKQYQDAFIIYIKIISWLMTSFIQKPCK